MKKSRYITAFFLLASLILPNMALAADIEVKSENIVFIGDVSEEDGKRLVRNLEIYRNTIISLVGLKGKPDNKILRVYGSKNSQTLSKFTGEKGLAGVYKQGLQGPVFVTITKGGFKKGRWSSQVALHEYGHHVLHGMSRDDFPRWYDEGFANYLSSFKIEGDIITIGAPNVEHGRALKGNRWMDPETVLGAIHNYPRTRHIGKFYGQSWLYVHYMQNTPELGRKLPVYLENLEAGQDPLPAFEAAYGMTVKAFHSKARQYWAENAFPVMQFKASETLLNPDISVKRLNENQALLAYAEGQQNFMSKKTAKSLLKKFDKISGPLSSSPDVLFGKGHSAMFLEDYDRAKNYVSQGLEQSPKNIEMLSLWGDIHYHELTDAASKATSKGDIMRLSGAFDAKPVITHFENALSVDPDDFTAVTHLVNLYGRSNSPLSPIGKKAAERMAQSYLRPSDVGAHLDLANIYMQNIDNRIACAFYGIAKARVSTYDDKKVNDDFARAEVFGRAHPECG